MTTDIQDNSHIYPSWYDDEEDHSHRADCPKCGTELVATDDFVITRSQKFHLDLCEICGDLYALEEIN